MAQAGVQLILGTLAILVSTGGMGVAQSIPGLNPLNTPPSLNTLQSNGLTAQGLRTGASVGQYVVYVNGTSDLLLSQIRRVEPGAFRTRFRNQSVIQAGRFVSQANARNQVNQLSRQGIVGFVETLANQGGEAYGISAESSPIASYPTPSAASGATYSSGVQTGTLATVPLTTSIPPTLGFTAPSVTAPTNSLAQFSPASTGLTVGTGLARFYYVAIPGSAGELADLTTAVIDAGVNPANVTQKASPRGSFVAVGPFNDRLSAAVMEASLKDYGLRSARVYYGY